MFERLLSIHNFHYLKKELNLPVATKALSNSSPWIPTKSKPEKTLSCKTNYITA